jgi:preprotein translocase subunit SecG
MDSKKQKKTIRMMWIITIIFLLIVLVIGFIAIRKHKESHLQRTESGIKKGFSKADKKAKETLNKIEKVFDK